MEWRNFPGLREKQAERRQGGRTLLETSLGSWRPSRDACLILLQQLFRSCRAKAAPCRGAPALRRCVRRAGRSEGRGERRGREERPGSASGSARVPKAPQGWGMRHLALAMPLCRLTLELAVRETFEVPCSAPVVS